MASSAPLEEEDHEEMCLVYLGANDSMALVPQRDAHLQRLSAIESASLLQHTGARQLAW